MDKGVAITNLTGVSDYLDWRGDLSFAADKLNEADGAVLARFFCVPFEFLGDLALARGKGRKYYKKGL